MKKYIFCNYFRDRDPERAREYLTCVYRNLNLSWVDAVYIFVEDPDHAECTHKGEQVRAVKRSQFVRGALARG